MGAYNEKRKRDKKREKEKAKKQRDDARIAALSQRPVSELDEEITKLQSKKATEKNDKTQYQLRMFQAARTVAAQRSSTTSHATKGGAPVASIFDDGSDDSSSEDEIIKAKRRRLQMLRGETVEESESEEEEEEEQATFTTLTATVQAPSWSTDVECMPTDALASVNSLTFPPGLLLEEPPGLSRPHWVRTPPAQHTYITMPAPAPMPTPGAMPFPHLHSLVPTQAQIDPAAQGFAPPLPPPMPVSMAAYSYPQHPQHHPHQQYPYHPQFAVPPPPMAAGLSYPPLPSHAHASFPAPSHAYPPAAPPPTESHAPRRTRDTRGGRHDKHARAAEDAVNDPLLAYLPAAERARAPRSFVVKASELLQQEDTAEAGDAAVPVIGPVARAAPRFVPAAVQSRKVAQQLSGQGVRPTGSAGGSSKVDLVPEVGPGGGE